MLGCHRGIAIVEDKYRKELNPNVAMEWGWMRGFRRPVLFLVEASFESARADWSGLISSEFTWPQSKGKWKGAAKLEKIVRDWLERDPASG